MTVPWQIVRYYQQKSLSLSSLVYMLVFNSLYTTFSYPSVTVWIQLQSDLASKMSFIFLLHKQRAQLRCFVSFRDILFLLNFFANKDFSFIFTPKSVKRNESRAMQKAARKPIGIIWSCSCWPCNRHQTLCFKSMIWLLIHLKLLNLASWGYWPKEKSVSLQWARMKPVHCLQLLERWTVFDRPK